MLKRIGRHRAINEMIHDGGRKKRPILLLIGRYWASRIHR